MVYTPSKAQQSGQPSATTKRMAAFDVVRGFSVISMVLFHFCYDLRFIYGYDLDFFKPPFQDIWRASISWTFLFIAGCMCSFSRNGYKRALRYLAAAAAVFVVTTIVAVDVPISFGIIFCMGASTLIESFLAHHGVVLKGLPTAALLFMAFIAFQGVTRGYIGIGSLVVHLPRALYATPYLSFLGFPGGGFASGDYYPILPYTLMFLVGTSVGRYWKETGYPSFFSKVDCKPLAFVGRYALPVYLAHQPLLIGVCELLELIGN